MLLSSNAIVLKTIPYSDTSIISRIFTENNGKISIIAKGAWRPKKTIGSMLEPMKHIHINYYYKDNRNIQVCKDVELINTFSILRTKLEQIILGQVIVESLDKSTMENNSMPVLYKLVWRILDKMNNQKLNCWMVFAFYLYQLSIRLGFKPNFTSCCKCNKFLDNAIIDDQIGELICSSCNTQSKLILNENSLIFLKNLDKMHLDEIQSPMENTLEMFNAINFLKVFNCFHLDGMDRVKSLDMINKLLKK